MGFFDRLFGTATNTTPEPPVIAAPRTDDQIAVERYRYLLRTAPPETIESVHREAFAKLTPEQRELLFAELSKNAPPGDAPRSSDADVLATAATRSELRQPGTMERSMSSRGQGAPSFGSMVGSSLLGTVAGYVIGSALVGAFLPVDSGADATADAADGTDGTGTDGTGTDGTGTDGTGTDGGFDSAGGDSAAGGFGDFDGGSDFGGGFDF